MHASALSDTQQLTYQSSPASKVDRIDRGVVRCERSGVMSGHVQELSTTACHMNCTVMIKAKQYMHDRADVLTHAHTHTSQTMESNKLQVLRLQDAGRRTQEGIVLECHTKIISCGIMQETV